MINLGKKDQVFGADQLIPLKIEGRPTQLPTTPEESKVLCEFNQGLGERIIVCNTLEEMQELYDAYATGGALRIKWYHAKDPGFVIAII